MVRWLAAALAVVLMVVGILFWRHDRAGAEAPPALAPPPAASAEVTPADDPPPAASEATREERRFRRYDRDRDGIVAREEYLRSRRTAFAKLDTNGDGRLSFEEWAIRTTTKFAQADADRSGGLNAAEFATTAVKRAPPKARTECVCAPDDD